MHAYVFTYNSCSYIYITPFFVHVYDHMYIIFIYSYTQVKLEPEFNTGITHAKGVITVRNPSPQRAPPPPPSSPRPPQMYSRTQS